MKEGRSRGPGPFGGRRGGWRQPRQDTTPDAGRSGCSGQAQHAARLCVDVDFVECWAGGQPRDHHHVAAHRDEPASPRRHPHLAHTEGEAAGGALGGGVVAAGQAGQGRVSVSWEQGTLQKQGKHSSQKSTQTGKAGRQAGSGWGIAVHSAKCSAAAGTHEKLYCVLAMHTGSCAKPCRVYCSSDASAAAEYSTAPAP